jgi:DNA-binding GntR family transcriptional regulator
MTSHEPKTSLKGSQAAEQLRRDILSGDLIEGTPLRQSAIARRFGVSAIPIREALRELIQEGLVITHPFQGASVAPLIPEEILQFARIRIALETEALAMAFPFHTKESLAAVGQHLEATKTARDLETFFHLYSEFLRALFEPGGYPYLLAEIMRIVARSQRYAVLNAEILKHLPKNVPMPVDIISALQAGDLPLAQSRLRLLYENSSILAASILYQRQLETTTVPRRPRGRPRKVLP